MNPGQIIIVISFFSAAAAAVLFFRQGKHALAHPDKPGRPPAGPGGRGGGGELLSAPFFYRIAVLASLVASILLLAFLLGHRFQYSYVAKYTSSEQPLLYLISAFWAGQEGTFLAWSLFVAFMGAVFLRTRAKDDRYAMGIVSAFLAFLSLLMIVKSPFETMPAVPPDGQGMNPLLMDPWMAIHPPILFIGYGAALFPFALVISGLLRRDYRHWFSAGFAWTAFAALTLGAGIIIGGFWAYEVLGWGGYWGWDPVENSSLVPWLALLALIHGLLVQKAKGSLPRTNMLLALVSFLLVLYATFLTRSGVLADFSVHSFEDLGFNNYLIGAMAASVALSFGLFVTRFREIAGPKVDLSNLNREMTLVLSLFVLCASALFTFVGMSSPILTGLFGKASQVDVSFYNKVNLPVGIAIALLLGVTPFLGWKEEKRPGFLKRFSMPLLLTALALAIAYVAGVTSALILLFVGAASFALISNVIIAFRQYRSDWTMLAGPIAHIGAALLLIGIVGSGKFDQTTQLVLVAGQPQEVYGYHLTFLGVDSSRGVKQQVTIEVSDGKSGYTARPKLYYSEYNRAMMREPDIKVYPLSDLYISPLELKTPEAHQHPPLEDGNQIEIAKGETREAGPYRITFVRFDVGQHEQTGAMSVGAVLNVGVSGVSREVIPELSFGKQGERESPPVDLPPPGGRSAMGAHKPQVALAAISVEEKKVLLQLSGTEPPSPHAPAQDVRIQQPSQLILEVSTKPLMMVLWTGLVLIIGGAALGFARRLRPGSEEGNVLSHG